MRAPRQLIGVSLAALLLLCAAPAAAAMKPFIAPEPRPTEHLRPTNQPGPNRNTYSVPQAPQSPSCTAHFCVHWVAVGPDAPDLSDNNGVADGDGVPDYVERVKATAEHAYSVENGRLGWRDPKSDGTEGGGVGKTDIYLVNLGGALFGYAAPDRGQVSKSHLTPRRLHGYLVLDNNYAPSEFPGTIPLNDLRVTLAHEYNHILQFGYDAYQDPWFAESTAVWMEDQVYNGINDYVRYVKRWTPRFDTPLTTSSIKEYGSAVWNTWLGHRYGRSIIRSAWARAIHTKPGGFAVSAYESAIRAAGNDDFSRDFADFSRDVAEWRTGSIFRDGPLYPNVAREGSLPTDDSEQVRHLNHTTFQLLRMSASKAKTVIVNALAPRGIESGLALVGRIGSERHGRVISRLSFAPDGGAMTVRLGKPGRFSRLTAVLVNADARADGFSPRLLDWRYLDEQAPYAISARVVH